MTWFLNDHWVQPRLQTETPSDSCGPGLHQDQDLDSSSTPGTSSESLCLSILPPSLIDRWVSWLDWIATDPPGWFLFYPRASWWHHSNWKPEFIRFMCSRPLKGLPSCLTPHLDFSSQRLKASEGETVEDVTPDPGLWERQEVIWIRSHQTLEDQ